MFIELHLIQNFVPSNLNRDDSNNPKDCEFGGHRRARISSQCIKRTIRTSDVFQQCTQVKNGRRIDYLFDLLYPPMKAEKPDAPDTEITTVLRTFIRVYAGDFNEKRQNRTKVLIYFADDEIQPIVKTLAENWESMVQVASEMEGETKKKLKQQKPIRGVLTKVIDATKDRTSAPDVAMFGRMLAENPNLNHHASCQVAHAISTHRVTMDVDYFTAIADKKDDLLEIDDEDNEMGAGMLGLTGFNSSCYYRYARIDWRQLVKNLKGSTDIAQRTVEGFIKASLDKVPTGKQNSHAHNNIPSFALTVVRKDGMGWSLANAFEKPVRPQQNTGLLEPSVARLDQYWHCLKQAYGDETLVTVAAFGPHPDLPIKHLNDNLIISRQQWLNSILDSLPIEQDK